MPWLTYWSYKNWTFIECQLYARKKVYTLKVLKVRPFHNLRQSRQTLKGQAANNLDFACHTVPVVTTQLSHSSLKSATDNTEMNECGSVSRTLWILKFEFHIIFTSQSKLMFLYNHLKMVKTILSSKVL